MKKFVFLYKDHIEKNGNGITSGVFEGVFTEETWRILDALYDALNHNFTRMQDWKISPYFEGEQSGGYKLRLDYHKDAPDELIGSMQDFIRNEVDVLSENEFFDRIEEDIKEKFKDYFLNKDAFPQAKANALKEQDSSDTGYVVLDWLVDDHHGRYMFERLLHVAGVDIPADISDYEGWCELSEEWLGKISEVIDLDGCVVDFIEGGIALLYYPPEEASMDFEIIAVIKTVCGIIEEVKTVIGDRSMQDAWLEAKKLAMEMIKKSVPDVSEDELAEFEEDAGRGFTSLDGETDVAIKETEITDVRVKCESSQ